MSRIPLLVLLLPLLSLGCDSEEDVEDSGPGDTTPGTTDSNDTDTTDTEDTYVPPEYYGPENQWWHALAQDVPADLTGTGWSVGDVAPNFTLTDQNGDEVELYQFYGRTVLLDLFAYW